MSEKFILDKKIEVTKEEYILHLVEKSAYWKERLHKLEDINQKALVKYQEKLNRSEREVSQIILRINEQIKELRK